MEDMLKKLGRTEKLHLPPIFLPWKIEIMSSRETETIRKTKLSVAAISSRQARKTKLYKSGLIFRNNWLIFEDYLAFFYIDYYFFSCLDLIFNDKES